MCTELVNTRAPSSGRSAYTKTLRQHREQFLVVHVDPASTSKACLCVSSPSPPCRDVRLLGAVLCHLCRGKRAPREDKALTALCNADAVAPDLYEVRVVRHKAAFDKGVVNDGVQGTSHGGSNVSALGVVLRQGRTGSLRCTSCPGATCECIVSWWQRVCISRS